jgi:hypothetical protein
MSGATTVIVATILTACGIQTDGKPRDVPEADQRLATAVAAGGADASGASRVYLIGPGEQHLLRSVPRQADTRQRLIEVLLQGPNDEELNEQYSSVIPPLTRVLSSESVGNVLFVDLSSEITALSVQGLTQALAQIVYTASELDGVQAVQITVDGEPLLLPKGDGGSTTEPLRTYDYPGFVETAQPAYPEVPLNIEPFDVTSSAPDNSSSTTD